MGSLLFEIYNFLQKSEKIFALISLLIKCIYMWHLKNAYMTQIRDDSTFTSFAVTKKLKYIDHHFFAYEARDLILTFFENSAIN